jgi:hypothetical protein
MALSPAVLSTFRLGACSAIACFALAPSAHALVFNFEFDNVGDGLPLDPPIVGSGTFSFDGNPGPGTFALRTLPNFKFDFNFGGTTFNNANLATDPSLVFVEIFGAGNLFSLNFTGSDDPFSGSLGFISDAGDQLSFEPGEPGLDAPELYFSVTSNGETFGNYQATAVPGPLPLLGAASAFGFSRKLRRKIKSRRPEVIPTTKV